MSTEYEEIKQSIEVQGKKIDRLLSWAEGDSRLGTPSIAQQIKECENEVIKTRKRTYENAEHIRDLKTDVDNVKKMSGIVGASSGGAITAVWYAVKEIFLP